MKKVMIVLVVVLFAQSLMAQIPLRLATWSDPKDPVYVPILEWAKTAFKDAGYDLVVDYKPAERAIRDANEGVDDGDLSRVKGIEATYPNLIMVPEPFATLNQVAYALKPVAARSIDDLAHLGLVVEVIIGNKIMDSYVKPKIEAAKYLEVADLDSALKLLHAGRADVLLVADLQIKSALGQPQNAGVKPLFIWMSISTYTYLNKKWADAVPKISESYKKVKR